MTVSTTAIDTTAHSSPRIVCCAIVIISLLSACATPSDPHRPTFAQAFGFSDPWGDSPWYGETPCGQWKVQRAEDIPDGLYTSTAWPQSNQLANTIRSINGVESYIHSRYEGTLRAGPYADRPAVFTAITSAIVADCHS
jgi:hypothetical protein